MPRIFTHHITVSPDAIDELGHVNNLVYLRWMQDVAILHSAARGWGLPRYIEIGSGWVVKTHFIDYVRPAHEGERLVLYTWVAGFTPRSSPRRYLFWRPDDGKVVGRAETNWVFVDFATGQPKQVPKDLRDSFEIVTDEAEVMALAQAEAQDGTRK